MSVHEEHKKKGPELVRLALIVVSTSRYIEFKEGKSPSDKTIPMVKELAKEYNSVDLMGCSIISDDEKQLKDELNKYLSNENIDAIIFSGGTGLSKKDISIETIEPLFDKKIDGFGELFRYLSYKDIGASAMLSRASAGIISKKPVFLLPGSPKAVELALKKLIIPELRHIVYIINKEE
ncbi:MAG: MogA/MoaB family molybdenum cofactor biosynthesis protein [Promethearchaeota archaeon]